MPAHSGNMTLTGIEVERAITHMVNQSGGKWDRTRQPHHPHASAQWQGDRTARTGSVAFDALRFEGHGAMPRHGVWPTSRPRIRSAIAYRLSSGTGATQ